MKQFSRVLSALLACALIFVLTGCQSAAQPAATAAPSARYTARVMDIFDTDITLSGYAVSQEAFDRTAGKVFECLREYNRIFDGYNAYGDLHNLWYVNRHAAQTPVEVPETFYQLLLWCREKWESGFRHTNIAMGSVLQIWHEYRAAGIADPQNAALPPEEALRAAARHTDFDSLILDSEKRTVYFSDPEMQLDLGAVAKGYAADLVLPLLREEMPSFLLSLGGNVYAGQPPLDGRANWNVGVQDPRADARQVALGGTDILDVLEIHDLTAVTSGDYWRYYVVNGEKYHHIIDPDTLYPAKKMMSVSVVCESSLLADYLSTTLFILSYEDGLRLVRGMEGVEVMWVEADGTLRFTPGMARYARSLKTAQ